MLFPVEFIKVVYLDFSLEKKEEKNCSVLNKLTQII